MPKLFVPLTGAFQKAAGSGFNTYGENLDRPQWHGSEISRCDTFPDVWGAVSESEFHDWIIGVHHPLYSENGPQWCRFFDRDPAVRAEALSIAEDSAAQAHHIGGRYILFHFPWPGFQPAGTDLKALGWYYQHEMERLEDWASEQEVYDVSRRAFERLAEVQAKEGISVVLELEGPNPHFFEGDMYTRLFTEFPDLSLCLDTGRLGLIAKTHGRDPIELARRWLPWTRYMHLHTSRWDEQGRFTNHIPTTARDTAEKWPHVTPAADIARMVAEAQPKCIIVLEHNPKLVTPAELEEAHAFAQSLVSIGR